ncbi:hypothetical protein JFQ74_003771 [Vibrio parahaemolyticus]|nr:hypothetical protein [Vibrio parahaemolyticus]HCG9257872.1 hypothetical protein [Vibrio parahaemolyticus]
MLNKAEYKENSELNTSGYELTERNKAKIDECLKERQKAVDARTGEEGYNAQIGNINQQSAKIGELAADDFDRSKRPNAKLLHPKDIGTSISKPGDFDMVYEVEEPPPGEIIIVEAKGGSSPLGSRKIQHAASFGIPIRYIHTQANIPESGNVTDVRVEVAEFKINSKGLI